MGADQEIESTRMTLGDHLEELRKRVFRSVLVLAIAFLVAWFFKEELAEYVLWPWREAAGQINADLRAKADARLAEDPSLPRTEFYVSADPAETRLKDEVDPRPSMFGIGEGFFFALNVSMWFALLIGSPFALWQVWQFVAAGLYRHEKRAVLRYFPWSVLLFLTGVAFCFLLVVPTGMYYLATTFPQEMMRTVMGIDQYTSFLTTLCLAMGLVFQLPILMIFLARMGIVDPKTYSRYRGHFVIVALIVAAAVTPGPDYVSQLMMTAPMLLLYEVGIFVSRLSARARRHPGSAP
jgi:sec-independent protein translocase protein TatC